GWGWGWARGRLPTSVGGRPGVGRRPARARAVPRLARAALLLLGAAGARLLRSAAAEARLLRTAWARLLGAARALLVAGGARSEQAARFFCGRGGRLRRRGRPLPGG